MKRFQLSTVPQLLAASIATRLTTDTTAQLFNSFLVTIAAGLGMDVLTLGRLVSLRSLMGLASPLFGSAADRFGYRRVMRIGLLLAAAGMFFIGSGGGLATVVVGMVLSGIGLSAFVPTLQAYMSARLPYHQLARGIGILEYSWALAGIVGLFAMGFLFEDVGWQAPFFVLGAGMLGGWVLFGFFPSARTERTALQRSGMTGFSLARLAAFFDLGPNRRSAWAVIVSAALLFFAQFHVIIAHGAWLQAEYGLGPALLGSVALAQGLADLCGSVLVSLITDRVGKKRSVQAGMLGALLVFIALPFVNVGLWPVIGALVLMRFAFEFGIVANISLASEQAPDRRGKVMTLAAALNLLGGTITGFSGPWAYTHFGVWGLGPVAAISTAVALVLLTVWGREGAE
ncbi:MAG: MFS transporter [Caldilineaceae bacterium]|nr:MFS transporter [Caldilineaceae bacterium]HRJ40934.1 MFS transporter [Caldilineaceae bacterium]